MFDIINIFVDGRRTVVARHVETFKEANKIAVEASSKVTYKDFISDWIGIWIIDSESGDPLYVAVGCGPSHQTYTLGLVEFVTNIDSEGPEAAYV